MRRLSATSLRLIGAMGLALLAFEVVLPLGIISTYLLIEGVWSVKDLTAVAFYLACLPLLLLVSIALRVRREAPIIEGMEAIQAGTALEPGTLERMRKAALSAPGRAALSVGFGWTLLHPAALAFGMWRFGEHQQEWPEMFLAGILIAPLMGTMCKLTVEALLKPAIRLLFAKGGLHTYRIARNRTMTRRLIVVGGIWVYTLLVLISLTYRTLLGPDSMQEGLIRLLQLDAFFLAASLGMLVTLAYLSRRMMSEPLQNVLDSLQRVHDGDLTVRLPLEVADNLGILAERFNYMVEGLRERSQMQDAFGRYVSPEIARKAITGPLSLGGESREITVLFTDIRGFTALSESLTAEELVSLMNRYFELVVTCIRSNGGHVNKFIGDGLMALFGAPEKSARHAEHAVRSALAIEAAMDRFNMDQRANGEPELPVGVGIATGPVIIGNVGSHDRLEYTAMGDTVNIASRIEGLNRMLNSTILVSERTYQEAKESFVFLELGDIHVKGKRDSVRVYSPSAGAPTPAIARTSEVDA